MASIDTLANGIIEKNRKKLNEGSSNGDTETDMFILLTATFEQVKKLNDNPAVKYGNLVKEYPSVGWLSFLVAWVISLITIGGSIYAFLDKVGLLIVKAVP